MRVMKHEQKEAEMKYYRYYFTKNVTKIQVMRYEIKHLNTIVILEYDVLATIPRDC